MKLSPVSALVGALLAAVVFLSMAQTTLSSPLRLEYLSHPRDHVRIPEGSVYTVPAGKLLVLAGAGTALGTGNGSVSLHINGAFTEFYSAVGGGNLFLETPKGMVYGPGTTLQVLDNTSGAQETYAVGYLADK